MARVAQTSVLSAVPADDIGIFNLGADILGGKIYHNCIFCADHFVEPQYNKDAF